MKRFIGLSVLVLPALFSYSQEIQQRNVPAVVLNAFQLKFSNSTDIEWKSEKGNYRVEFEVNNKDNEVLIDNKGIILRHLQDLYVSEIPKFVLETIQSKIAFFDVSDADKLEDGGKITYKVNLEINDKKNEFVTDERGKLLIYTKELRDSEVPVQIMALIKTKYGTPDIDDAWYSEENGTINYRINGEINDLDHTFLFNDKTTLLKHEQELRINDVPANVLKSAKTAYSGYEIKNPSISEDGGKISYYLEMKKSKERIIVSFNQSGTILDVKKK